MEAKNLTPSAALLARRRLRRPHRLLLLLTLLCGATAGELHAQNREPARPNDPSTDPYTGGEAERMEAAGVVSLGGFEFASSDTAGIDSVLGAADIRWVETAHFEIGMGLGPYKVNLKEKKKLIAELTALQETMPEVRPDVKVLDPWLRAHLFARRAEQAYARFLEIMHVKESDFPSDGNPWMIGTPYMGEGPHLGQKGKFEILILPSQALHVALLRDQFGLKIESTQRWFVIERDSLFVSMHPRQGDLKIDTAMHGHMVFNLAHLMLDGYRHYSYDTPKWLLEGLAHFMEREVDPRYNSFDSQEGAIPLESKKTEWDSEVKKILMKKDVPRAAELSQLDNYGDFELRHHLACWSMTKFMIEEHGEGYAALSRAMHGLKNKEGYADSADLKGKLRAAFRDHLGMNYAEFDVAWTEWAKAR